MPTLSLQPNAADGNDVWLNSFDPATNYGAYTALIVGDAYSAYSTAARNCIKFDFSSIPAGSTISSVTLSLYEYAAGSGGAAPATWDAHLRKILQNWVEAEATWNIYSSGNNWASAGCSSDGTDRIATPSASVTLDASVASAFIDWTGSGLVTDVQNYIDGEANYGWLLSADDAEYLGAGSYAYNGFYSSDFGTASLRPKIEVVYTLPRRIFITA